MAAGRSFRAILGVFVGAVLAGGCMFFRSLDDLSQGGVATPAPEDGGAAVDAPPIDARVDDVIVDVDAAPVSPCRGVHTFCDDFDVAEEAGVGWGATDVSPSSALFLSTARASTPPRALYSSVALRPAVEHATMSATLNKRFDRPIKKVHLEVDLYEERPAFKAGDVGVALLLLIVRGDSGFAGTILFNDGTSSAMSLEQLSGSDRYFEVPAVPFDTWGHIAIDLDLSGSLHFELPRGGGTKTFPAVTLGATPHADLAVGILSFDGPIPEHHAYYDNVLVDIE